MLPFVDSGAGAPTLVFLHYFGGSSREWTQVTSLLSAQHRCVAIDAPGFGDARDLDGYTVEEMTQHLLALTAALAPEPFLLVGHSMGGKVSMVAASRRPPGLLGLVLVAPSPLNPEPITEPDRAKMAAANHTEASAREFFLHGAYRHLTDAQIQQGTADALRANPIAWRRWPQSGSREDWSAAIPLIDIPTLLVIGEHDPAIPLVFQREYTLPHLIHGTLQVISGAGHLLPYEAHDELAGHIRDFAQTFSPATRETAPPSAERAP